MRRDEAFYPFVHVRTKWDRNAVDYGLQDEHDDSKLKRKKEELAEDLVSFLEIIAGYVPGDHLRMKILQDSTCFKDVVKIIREFYGAEINAESELDFMKIQRKPQEPYRQFFERLSSHAREHLLGKEITVGSITTGADGDSMTLSHLNLIVQIWLYKISPKLLDVVKKEYGKQLQEGKPLSELVPDIAKNMDNLLKTDSSVQRVSFEPTDTAGAIRQVLQGAEAAAQESLGETEGEELESEANNKIRKIFSKRRGGDRGRDRHRDGYRGRDGDRFQRRGEESPRWRDRESSASGRGYTGYRSERPDKNENKNSKHCAHCEYTKKVYGVKVDTKHDPTRCPGRKFIRRIMASDVSSEDNDLEGAARKKKTSKSTTSYFQTDRAERKERRVPPLPSEYDDKNVIFYSGPKYQDNSKEIILTDLTPSQISSLEANIRRVVSHKSPRKKKSPSIKGRIKGTSFIITIDEGAEMNILSAEIARQCRIPITNTIQNAASADGNGLRVIGQTLLDCSVFSNFQGNELEINLGRAIVVEGLESDVLLGEPGKRDNELWTKASESKVYMERNGKEYSTSYHSHGGGKDSYGVARVKTTQEVQPGQSINIDVPFELSEATELVVNARKEDDAWFEPRVRRIIRGQINIKNVSDSTVKLKRGRPFCELRSTQRVDLPAINRVVMEDDEDFRYRKFAKKRDPGVSYLSETQVDPDKILPELWRTRFKNLLKEFDEVIDPAPGKYNGAFGDSNTIINFVGTPPPMEKVYSPNYSRDMMKQLADKMDILIDWGVLVKAEDIGVSVEHIATSLLVPKTDGDGYRMVNDYSRLNVFIGKEPTTSPSMQDVKNAIARKKFVTHLDLSNYFYQGGMRRADAQFLGVIHPFNGLYCYVVEPQGLRNASEHAYDRLAKIFGDMVKEDRMTRHADGLHVLGDTEEELYENLREVLSRIQRCGLSLKPSKVCVAPVSSILFGWRLDGVKWMPTEHTISALATAERPSTAKKMRGFLGSFKQYTDLVPHYAPLLHPLEAVQAGKGSGEYIEWTDDLVKAFEAAKKATGDLEAISTPRPTDRLHSYSDFSQEKRAVGGKLLIERVENGVTTWLLAGHYSATIDKNKTRWLPCEGEAAGIKMVLSHFSPWIIENNNITTHHTDNQPCVQAWNRLKKGAYSNSSRIASFLSELSMLSVDLVYKPGRDMHTSDFASRNPPKCNSPETCQICKFSREIEITGDKSANIRRISVEDIKAGRSVLPLTQRKVWTDIQSKDSAIEKFKHLAKIGQSPNKHKTKGEHTVIKKLYRLFVAGDVMIDKDGAVLVKAKDGAYSGYAMVVPTSIYPGLMHTLHIRLDHPSKSQLTALTQRYFYCHGFQSIIEQVTESCLQCASVKKLPKVLLQDTTEATDTCGLQFAADVMEQHQQKVLLVREKLTQMTWATLIEDQKADTLETALLTMILPITPSGGAVIRTDGGTGFQSLAMRGDTELAKNNIKIELGRLHNANKNPQAENTVKEFEKEMLRYDQNIKALRPIDICYILKTMNTRVRYQGLSSQEMLLKREMIRNEEISVTDSKLSEKQMENREKQSEYQRTFQSKSKKETTKQSFKVGQFVFIRNADTKTAARELYVITQLTKIRGQEFVVIRKAELQFRSRTYLLRPEELIPAPIFDRYKLSMDTETETDTDTVLPEDTDLSEAEDEDCYDTVPATDDYTVPATDNNTVPASQEALPTRRRSRRKSAEKARDLFKQVLKVTAVKKKKRNVNACLYNPYEDEDEENIVIMGGCIPYIVPFFPRSRAQDDIDGLGLLSESFESDTDFSLSLLEGSYMTSTLAGPLLPPPEARLMIDTSRVDPPSAPPSQPYGAPSSGTQTLHGLGGAPLSGKTSLISPAFTNSDNFHGANNYGDNLEDDNVFENGASTNVEVSLSYHTGDELPARVTTPAATWPQQERARPDSLATRVSRPLSLSSVPLTITQDLSTVLRAVHKTAPPAPPVVDRFRKRSVITSSRELRRRTESLDYKKVNEGKQYPSWRPRD